MEKSNLNVKVSNLVEDSSNLVRKNSLLLIKYDRKNNLTVDQHAILKKAYANCTLLVKRLTQMALKDKSLNFNSIIKATYANDSISLLSLLKMPTIDVLKELSSELRAELIKELNKTNNFVLFSVGRSDLSKIIIGLTPQNKFDIFKPLKNEKSVLDTIEEDFLIMILDGMPVSEHDRFFALLQNKSKEEIAKLRLILNERADIRKKFEIRKKALSYSI